MDAGYSGTPLAKKLGLKDGMVVGFVDLPDSVADLAEARAFSHVERVGDVAALSRCDFDVLHLFTKSAETLQRVLPDLQDRIAQAGMIWVSWPKKASKVATDMTEDVIRSMALSLKLVDVKVCAVDEIWSGLKLVIRKELRV